MTEALLLAVVDRHDGDLARVAATLGMSDATARERIASARLGSQPSTRTLASVEIAPDTWDRMTARMLLAVVDEAPSTQAAAYILGLTRRDLRDLLRRARQGR